MKVVRRNWPLVAIAFLFKFGLAFLFFIPLQGLVFGAFNNRPAATRLLTEWDMTPIIDFVYNNHNALEQYGYFIFVGIILTLALHLFLSGGFFRTLAVGLHEEKNVFNAERFFGWCGHYFWRLVMIAILSAIFYLALAVVYIILSKMGIRLILGELAPEPVRVFAALGRVTFLILLLMGVNVGLTYLKIVIVVQDYRSIFDAMGAAHRFLRTAYKRAILLYAEILIGLFLIIGMYWIFHKGCNTMPAPFAIITTFLVQQILSLTRSWYRLVGYASQMRLYREISN